MNNFAEQAAELNEAKESLNDFRLKLHESENNILELTKEISKLKKNSLKSLDYVYRELFSLSKPAQSKNSPNVVYEVDNQQHFLMKYEIAASIEPRLQEHIKKLKNKPTIDEKSLFVNESIDSISLQLSNQYIGIDLPSEIEGQSQSNNETVVSVRSIDLTEKNAFSLNSFEIIKIESVRNFSFSFPNHISIDPSIPGEKIVTNESSSSNRNHCIQLEFTNNEPFFVNSPELSNVEVQVEIEKKVEGRQKTVLTHQPPLEIFAVNETDIRPDQPIVLDPSSDLLSGLKNDENDKKQSKMLLLMKSGDFVDIPAMNEIDSSTGIDAANAVSQIVIQETAEISNKLKLVVSEIQSIDKEPDPAKRAQMQETLGVELDIEKDSLISQMRERITELESMMNRVTTQVENQNENEVKPAETVELNNVSLNSNSTQTDLVEFESVGITPTVFSSPSDITTKNKIEMSQSVTIANEPEKEARSTELGISSPSQAFDIDIPKQLISVLNLAFST